MLSVTKNVQLQIPLVVPNLRNDRNTSLPPSLNICVFKTYIATKLLMGQLIFRFHFCCLLCILADDIIILIVLFNMPDGYHYHLFLLN